MPLSTFPFLFSRYLLLLSLFLSISTASAEQASALPAPKAALTVTVDKPERQRLDLRLSANGNIAAWQEAIIGTEADGLRLAEVLVNVGDQVQRGQVLASFATDTLAVELAQSEANAAEAEAHAAEAAANAARARRVQGTGALSDQQLQQYFSAEKTTKARLLAQRAAIKVQQLRLAHARVLASDDGIISSRTATLGAVLPRGQELFRLLRQNRLEWRAEVTAAELSRIKAGMSAHIFASNGERIKGKIRMLAPTVNPQTRLGIVYVDLPKTSAFKAGMFAQGEFNLGDSDALTVLQQAVVVRDGFNYLFSVGPDNRVQAIKIQVGRRYQDRVEVIAGLTADTTVVVQGAGFLHAGDLVKVVQQPTPALTPANSSKP